MSLRIVYRYSGHPIPLWDGRGILREHVDRLLALPPLKKLYEKREWIPGWVGGKGDAGPPGFGQPVGAFEWDPMPEIKPGVLYWATGATRPAILVITLPGALLLDALRTPCPLFEFGFLDQNLHEVDYFYIPLFPVSWIRVGWVESPYPLGPTTTSTTTTREYDEPLPKSGRPEIIIPHGLYLTALVSWTYFLREIYVDITDTSSWAAICRDIFQALIEHGRVGAYLNFLQIERWYQLFIYREDDHEVPIPGWDTLPEYLETTTTTTTTTTTFECIPKGSTTTTTTTTSTTTTTTTTGDADYECLTVPNSTIWYGSRIPADCAIDAVAAHLCAIAHVSDLVYFRKVARPAVMTGQHLAGRIREGTGVQRLTVLAPECVENKLPSRRYFSDWKLPIARGDLQLTITESTCSKDCLYSRLFKIHKALWRRLGRGGKTASFVLTGTPFLPEQTDWISIDLAEGTATIRSAGAVHWPRSWAWDCPTTTTTTAPGLFGPRYEPKTRPRREPHPCTRCHCYWTCQGTQDGYYWVRIDELDECTEPCQCPEPFEVECDQEYVGAQWTVFCEEKPDDHCWGHYARWKWVQDGETYSEGHWELEEPCPNGCDSCYPEFCCEDETITLDDGTTTTQEYECTHTYTECFASGTRECPDGGAFPEGRDCRTTTSTTTSTTTTTPESCDGECTWIWTDQGYVRTKRDTPEHEDCPEGCTCCYPPDCSDVEYGDIVRGTCAKSASECPEVPDECTPIDPLCGPWPPGHPCCEDPHAPKPPKPRDCRCGREGRCVWYLAPPDPGSLTLLEFDCCPECPCELPQDIQLCGTEITYCRPEPPRPPRPAETRCRGGCIYVWCEWPDGWTGWVLIHGGCVRGTALECEWKTWKGSVRRSPCLECACGAPASGSYPCVGRCVWECQNGRWVQTMSCKDAGDGAGCTCPEVTLTQQCSNGDRISGACIGYNTYPVCGTLSIQDCVCVCPHYDCTSGP